MTQEISEDERMGMSGKSYIRADLMLVVWYNNFFDLVSSSISTIVWIKTKNLGFGNSGYLAISLVSSEKFLSAATDENSGTDSLH